VYPKKIVPVLLLCTLCRFAVAQPRMITGIVLDTLSHLPVPNVSISAGNSRRGMVAAPNGQFQISADRSIHQLVFVAIGYKPVTIDIPPTDTALVIYLIKKYSILQDVVITRKIRYRNKHNPAVELIRKVIANKARNGPGAEPYTAYREYEKTRLLLENIPRLMVDNFLIKKYHFFFENRDSAILPGRSLIPVYIEEVSSQKYGRKHPAADKKIVLAHKSVDFGEFIDMKGASSVINRLYEDIDIYDNTITAFTMQFVSPIADIAPSFYMYFIRDTIVDDGVKLVELDFMPRNPEDLLFRGTLYITLDGNYAIRKAQLGVGTHINLNYLREFKVTLDFQKGPAEHYHLAGSDMLALFSPLPKSMGMVGERLVTIDQFSDTAVADSIFKGRAVDSMRVAGGRVDSLDNGERPVPLSASEIQTYSNTDSLIHMRSYHRLMDYATAFTAGYKTAGKVDVGPIGSFYTFNPIEGNRLKLGARTNTRLSTRWFGESYVAYGTKDQRWKYFGSASYAFNNKSIYTFPLHYIQASYLDDARPLGQESAFAIANNFFTSFGHGDRSKWLYNKLARLTYIHELDNHFSSSFGVKYWQQSPTGSLLYIYKTITDQADTVSHLTTGELSTTLRWAPHETFIQNKAERVDIINRYPILTLQYARGIKGFLGGEYNYDAVHFRLYKRCYVSPIGYSDVTVDAGWLGGNLPFPLLVIHPGNASYFYSQNTYNMMNVGEFVSDHYAGVDIDHFFNGFFLNKVPGLKRLHLREVVAGKILYGGLRDENNPNLNPLQMRFPTTNGVTSTYSLGAKPYIEASVGLYNIFTIFRVDIVKRFTYLDHPGVSGIGLRISSNFNF
jgi:uncharacterized protein DUF5686/carboxypeptidase-like protein